MRRAAAVLAALLLTAGSADARPWRHHYYRRSTPIIAGQPSVRVTPSGNVVAPVMPLPRRLINGRVRQPHHHMGPG